MSGLGTKIDNVASEVEDVGDEVEDLEDELEDVGDNIEDGINNLEEEVEDVGGDVTDLQTEVVSLRSEVQILRASLETEFVKLRNEVKSLGRGGEIAGDACNTEGINEELVSLKTGQGNLQRDITLTLEALQEIKEQLTTTSAQGSSERANLETRLMATNEQVHNISRELTDLSHSKMNNIESELKDLKIDMASVREELDKTASATLSEFKGQLESVRTELDTMQENTNSTLQGFKGQLTDMAHQLTDTASQGSRERATSLPDCITLMVRAWHPPFCSIHRRVNIAGFNPSSKGY